MWAKRMTLDLVFVLKIMGFSDWYNPVLILSFTTQPSSLRSLLQYQIAFLLCCTCVCVWLKTVFAWINFLVIHTPPFSFSLLLTIWFPNLLVATGFILIPSSENNFFSLVNPPFFWLLDISLFPPVRQHQLIYDRWQCDICA